MNLKGLGKTDLAIIDGMLRQENPVSPKELSKLIGIGYHAVRTRMKVHVNMGLYKEAPGSGGRYIRNREYGVVSLLEQIKDHPDYIPPKAPPPDPRDDGKYHFPDSMREPGSGYEIIEY